MLHKADRARMKVVKNRWDWYCDEVCVDFVRVFTKPMGDHRDNTNEDHGYYSKAFKDGDWTLMNNGCDDCDF